MAAPPPHIPPAQRGIEHAIQGQVGPAAKVAAEEDGSGGFVFTVKCTQHWANPPTNTIRFRAQGTNQGQAVSAWQAHDAANPHT